MFAVEGDKGFQNPDIMMLSHRPLRIRDASAMTISEIEVLIVSFDHEPIRPDLPILADPWSARRKQNNHSVEEVLALKSNPSLGWEFAERIAESGRKSPLPKSEGFRWVNLAVELMFAERSGSRTPAEAVPVLKARQLEHSDVMGPIVRASLLGVDATTEVVAAALDLEPEVVFAYSDLFFNVIDRRDDRDYIQRLIRGNIPQSEAFACELAGITPETSLLTIASVGTVADVVVAAGLGKSRAQSSAALSETLRQEGLAAAVTWFAVPRNEHKPISPLVALGLSIAKHIDFQPGMAGPQDTHPPMAQSFQEQFEADAVNIRGELDRKFSEAVSTNLP